MSCRLRVGSETDNSSLALTACGDGESQDTQLLHASGVGDALEKSVHLHAAHGDLETKDTMLPKFDIQLNNNNDSSSDNQTSYKDIHLRDVSNFPSLSLAVCDDGESKDSLFFGFIALISN